MSYDPNNPALREWARKRRAQIDWMDAMTRAGVYAGPDCPSMPDWMRTTTDDVRRAFGTS